MYMRQKLEKNTMLEVVLPFWSELYLLNRNISSISIQ